VKLINEVWEVLNRLIAGGHLLDPGLWTGVEVSRKTSLIAVLALRRVRGALEGTGPGAAPIPEPLAAALDAAVAAVADEPPKLIPEHLAGIRQLILAQPTLGEALSEVLKQLCRCFLQDVFRRRSNEKTVEMLPVLHEDHRYFINDGSGTPRCPICNTTVRRGSRITTGVVTASVLPLGALSPTHNKKPMNEQTADNGDPGEIHQDLLDAGDERREMTQAGGADEATDASPPDKALGPGPENEVEESGIQETAEPLVGEEWVTEAEEPPEEEEPVSSGATPQSGPDMDLCGKEPLPVPERAEVAQHVKAAADLSALLGAVSRLFGAKDWRSGFCRFLAKHTELAAKMLGPESERCDALYRQVWKIWSHDAEFTACGSDSPADWEDLKHNWEAGLRQELWEACRSLAGITKDSEILQLMADSADVFHDWRSQFAKMLLKTNRAMVVDCLRAIGALPIYGKQGPAQSAKVLTVLFKTFLKDATVAGLHHSHEELCRRWLGAEGLEFAAVFRLLYQRELLANGLKATGDYCRGWREAVCRVLAEDTGWGLKYLIAWNVVHIRLPMGLSLADDDLVELRKRLPEQIRATLPENPELLRKLLEVTSAYMAPLIENLKVNLAGLAALKQGQGE
jgi:hypothetical protein